MIQEKEYDDARNNYAQNLIRVMRQHSLIYCEEEEEDIADYVFKNI